MDEFALIAEYFAGDAGAVLGIGDDAALVEVPLGQQLAIAVDTLVAGRHFPEATPPEAIGHRALAVNLSDLAAMGATPHWYTLALTLPEAEPTWLAGFSKGLRSLGAAHGCALIGGDTTRGSLTVTVQVMGAVTAPALTRGGACPGDRVFVGGFLGDAVGGLNDAAQGLHSALASRFHYPQPQLALGQALRHVATACIDVSDGFVADLNHVLRASGVGAEIDLESLPLSPELVASVGHEAAQRLALSGGDDYVLCFTVPAEARAACLSACHEVGRITTEPGLRLRDRDGAFIEEVVDGYRHF
ncbi:MAG: thiamine-phosphate kinase [Pseudomonadota bacterium]